MLFNPFLGVLGREGSCMGCFSLVFVELLLVVRVRRQAVGLSRSDVPVGSCSRQVLSLISHGLGGE